MNLLSPYQRARILLLAACIACVALFWWTSATLRIPMHPGYEDGLLQQPSPALAMLVVAALFVVCAAIGTALAGVIRFNAGLFAACVGLGALSARAGSSRASIFWGLAHNDSPSLFLPMLADMIYLAILVTACGVILNLLYGKGLLKDRESGLSDEPGESSLPNTLSALAFQAVITAVAIYFLARTEAKQQVWAAVGIGAFAGSAIAESFLPTGRPSYAFIPPLLVGILGYILVYFDPTGYKTADLTGSYADLARPLPLDYAAAGPAGALLGLWLARAWSREKQQGEAAGAQA
jgi:hypothetical protein